MKKTAEAAVKLSLCKSSPAEAGPFFYKKI